MFGAPAGAVAPRPVAVDDSNQNEPPSLLSTVGEVLAAQEIIPTQEKSTEVNSEENTDVATQGALHTVRSANLLTRALGQPSAWLAILYSLIAVFVFVSLVLAIVIEWRRQHPVQIAYGVGMLGLLGILFYAHTWLVGGALII